MTARRFLPSILIICALGFVPLVAGCGGDDDTSGGASVASTAAPEPLPIEQRVIEGDLGGVALREVQGASTPEEFSKLVDTDDAAKEAAALRKAGFVKGAVKTSSESSADAEVFGLSGVIQYGTPEQAAAELDRLYKEFSSDLPPGAKLGVLDGVPGSRTIMATGMDRNQAFDFGAALFSDGLFLHAQLAGGTPAMVTPQGVLDAASELYERVKGRPAS